MSNFEYFAKVIKGLNEIDRNVIRLSDLFENGFFQTSNINKDSIIEFHLKLLQFDIERLLTQVKNKQANESIV